MALGRPYSESEKLAAVRREIGFRKRVYADRVANRKMSQEKADFEIGVMEAIAADYEPKAAGERLL